MSTSSPATLDRYIVFCWGFVLLTMWVVLQFNLVVLALTIMVVYSVIDAMSTWLQRYWKSRWGVLICLLLFTAVFVFVLLTVGSSIWQYFEQDQNHPRLLLNALQQILERNYWLLPLELQQILPAPSSWSELSRLWLRENSDVLQRTGSQLGTALFHILMGVLIGSMMALTSRTVVAGSSQGLIGRAFWQIRLAWFDVFAKSARNQLRLALMNVVIVALLGFFIGAPYLNVLCLWVFGLSLLPNIGTVLVAIVLAVVGLSESYLHAVCGLALGLLLSKLEVFWISKWQRHMLNGATITAAEQFLLLILAETLFGFSAIVFVPLCYAFFKREWRYYGLV